MLPITKQISNFNHSAPNNIQYIVVHDTGNVTDSAQGNANYFCSADRQSSAHLFVDDNSIYQVVEFTDGSWHCGDGQGKYGITNHNSIGIEMCRVNNTVTATTEANTIELVKYLMSKFNIPIDKVVRHYDASRKNCPSSFSANNWERWTNFKNKLVNAPVVNPVNQGGDYMSKAYHNGSTPEPVYSEEACINKIGSLNAYESCEAIADVNSKIIVLYNTANGKKTGFVKYRGGL